jgi:hypothetical protein
MDFVCLENITIHYGHRIFETTNSLNSINYGEQKMSLEKLVPTGYDLEKSGTNGNIIAVIMDESGSMHHARDSTISAFNEFLEGQIAASETSGKGYMTLVKFDAPEIKRVYHNRPLNEVPKLNHETYDPRGATNLNDAIGDTIKHINLTLKPLPVSERPGVIIVIMTDGQENSSHTYSTDEIKTLISAAEKMEWTFTFLGANIDAFAASSALGMGAHNTLQYSTQNMKGTMSSLSGSVASMRTSKSMGMSTAEMYSTGLYTDEQRKNAT